MRLILGLDYPNASTATIDGKQYVHLAGRPHEPRSATGELTQRIGVQVCDIHLLSLAPPKTIDLRI